jgi:alkaline phosphatase D
MRIDRRNELRAIAVALAVTCLGAGCGGPPKSQGEQSAAVSKDDEAKPPQVELPPLASPDCAAALPALEAAPPKVTEADGFRAAGTEGAAKISAGPILGDMTDQSVAVWIRADRPTPWRVSVWPDKQAKKKVVIEGPEPTKESDFTATVRLDKLAPSTAYEYAVELGAAGKDAVKLPKSTFHTLAAPGTAGKLRIAVGARLSADVQQPIFTQISEVKPDLMLLIGDQIYSGNLKANFPAYAGKYERNFRIVQLQELMQSVPTYMMWDDQDIKLNYFAGSSKNRYEPARLAYDLYGHAHNPPPVRDGELHYQFQAGDVSFFVIDARSYRADPEDNDGPHKTMLGETQKADLARFLKCAPGKIKVLVTTVPFSNQVPSEGSWRDYEAERQQIIRFIESEKVDNLIVLTGDQAWSALLLHNHKHTRFYELMPTPLSKELGKAPKKESKGIIARDDDNHVFGVVDIDTSVKPATIAFTLCAKGKPCKPGEEPAPTTGLDQEGAQENVPFTLKITEDDIGPIGAPAVAPAK